MRRKSLTVRRMSKMRCSHQCFGHARIDVACEGQSNEAQEANHGGGCAFVTDESNVVAAIQGMEARQEGGRRN